MRQAGLIQHTKPHAGAVEPTGLRPPGPVRRSVTGVRVTFDITLDGQRPGEDGREVRRAEVRIDGREEMTAEQIIAEVERQLRDQGVEADV